MNVGDRVIVNHRYPVSTVSGKTGTVISLDELPFGVGVSLDGVNYGTDFFHEYEVDPYIEAPC